MICPVAWPTTFANDPRKGTKYIIEEQVRARSTNCVLRTDKGNAGRVICLRPKRVMVVTGDYDGCGLCCRATIQPFGQSQDEYAWGRSKIFIKSPKSLLLLEECRRISCIKLLCKIQATWRGYSQQKKYKAMRK